MKNVWQDRFNACLRFAVVLLATAVPPACALDIEGTVVDGSGEGIAGATVWMRQDRDVTATQSDASGAFVFSDVAPRPAEVVARKEGYAVAGADAFAVARGAVCLVLVEPDVLRLRIKDPDYEPVAGARIKTMVVGDAFDTCVFEFLVEDLVEQGLPPVRSDDEGGLVVPELPTEGHVRFVVSHRHYADTQVAYLPIGGKEQTILLYPGVTLRGRVTDQAGRGVARAGVSVFRIGIGAQDRFAEVLTDPEGFYRAVLRPGDYQVAVRHPDYASPKSQAIALSGESALSESSDGTVLDFALLAPHAIEGSVVYPEREACGAVAVSYWIDDVLYEETLTQQDGRFRLLVPNDQGRVRVAPPDGFMTDTLVNMSVKGKLKPGITLAPFRLEQLPEIAGTVLGVDGLPAPDVLISSLDLSPKVWAITDGEGQFRIRLGRMPPKAKVSFRAEHRLRFLRQDFRVALRSPKRVSVTLRPFEPDLRKQGTEPGENGLSSLVGKPAPEIACDAWFNSEPVALEAHRGTVVALTFWGGFDTREPAFERIEELRALWDLYRSVDDVAFVSVHDASKDPEEVRKYVRDYRIAFPVGRDTDQFETFTRYKIRDIPQTVLIDKKGILQYCRVKGRLPELIKGLRRLN